MVDYRTEKDSLGEIHVPLDALYGGFSARAKENFPISGLRVHPELNRGIILIKKVAAIVNSRLGLLERAVAKQIIDACDELLKGKYADQFVIDVYQAGAGTPWNMNVNEVIANLAAKRSHLIIGTYTQVHPNDHVNMSQSTNDVIPTAIRLAALKRIGALLEEIRGLENAFEMHAKKHQKTIALGRTHLEDAVPITYGQVFGSYAQSLRKQEILVRNASDGLRELGIGGTAVGTGINTHPKYHRLMVAQLGRLSGLHLRTSRDLVELTWNMDAFMHVSASVRNLSVDLIKICNDLRLKNSGPQGGFAEIMLPEVEPGSSIMPGKVNPSIPEMVTMVCYQVVGNDTAIVMAGQAGQLELNTMTPLIAHNLLSSIDLLTNAIKIMRSSAVEGLSVNVTHNDWLVRRSLILATALNPYIGYEVGASLVKYSLQEGKSLREVLIEHDVIPKKYVDFLLDPDRMTTPSAVVQKIRKAIQAYPGYVKFKQII